MTALYNENAAYPAAWLRNLITEGHVAAGPVSEQSIRDLEPDDVRDAVQFHAFAGIGGWSYALRLAGWPDDLPVWTGSCPCQPFSAAGRKKGFTDDRHLWPAWFRLITECRPSVIFGEQVANPDALKWLDLVQADLEGAGYTVGAADLCAAGVGAPHIRQRLYFVAIAGGQRQQGLRLQLQQRKARPAVSEAAGRGEADGLADAECFGGARRPSTEDGNGPEQSDRRSNDGELADTYSNRRGEGFRGRTFSEGGDRTASLDCSLVGDASRAGSSRDAGAAPGAKDESPEQRFGARRVAHELGPAGSTAGLWADADWWLCRDGFARPAQPGSFPLASGVPGRVGLLRAYGNSIVPQVAATFVRACVDAITGGLDE